MIKAFYTRFRFALDEETWQRYLNRLHPDFHPEINRFRRWQDRHSRLFGRLLLFEAAKSFGLDPELINNFSYNDFGRPQLKDNIDFNISHSGQFVICVMTDSGKTGVDIEEIRPVAISDFINVMTLIERQTIEQSTNPYKTFFEYWTMKESVIKANGKGLSVPLSEIHIHRNSATLKEKRWLLKEVRIAPEYKCYLAVDERHTEFIVRNVKLL